VKTIQVFAIAEIGESGVGHLRNTQTEISQILAVLEVGQAGIAYLRPVQNENG
jgi:hypothetical protein